MSEAVKTGLSALIPAEFFIPQPAKREDKNGRISLIPQGKVYAGQILVEWGRGCPIFNENLAAARQLKNDGYGTYRPDSGGWVFAPHAVADVIEAFPTLEVTSHVLDLMDDPPEAPRDLHGTIALNQQKTQWLVAFGGQYMVPKDAFGRYLDAARTIKQAIPGCWGWQSGSKQWAFSRKAAAAIIEAFPKEYFDQPDQLLRDAEDNPTATITTQPIKAQEPVKQEPDDYATRLLTTAEAILATL